jgi:RNA polymerase sigma factor (sigma-70 family)
MYEQSTMLQTDPSLLPFLRATCEAEQERLLASLVSEQAGPLIRRIIRNRLRFRASGQSAPHDSESEDIYGEVVVRLLKRLREFKADPGAGAINDFHGYIAVTTLNACHDYLRKKYPQRRGLENKLRYLLIRAPGFALWQNEDGDWLCGLKAWKGRNTNRAEAKRIDQLRENPCAFLPASMSGAGARLTEDTLAAVFAFAGRPIELGDLITVVANLRNVKDSNVNYDEYPVERVADPGLGSDTIFELRVSLQHLWKEICALPPRQRAALLLNLRDKQGRDLIALIPDTHTASFKEIAEALDVPLETFAQLWQKLPLDDAAIAEQLGATPRQVIRLRKCARDRLIKRMRAYEGRPYEHPQKGRAGSG